jgi:hypothetical protein
LDTDAARTELEIRTYGTVLTIMKLLLPQTNFF